MTHRCEVFQEVIFAPVAPPRSGGAVFFLLYFRGQIECGADVQQVERVRERISSVRP